MRSTKRSFLLRDATVHSTSKSGVVLSSAVNSRRRTDLRHILVVDDDRGTCETFALILRLAGYSTAAVPSAEVAVETIRESEPLLVIADLCLPGMSGLDLLQHLKAHRSRVPFILTTAFGDTKVAVSALKCGASDYLEKPIDESTLLHAAHEALRSANTCCGTPVDHAAARLAALIAPVLDFQQDPKTQTLWARGVAVSKGALRSICYTATVQPKKAHRFARVLRAVHLHRETTPVEALLDIVDLRSFQRLLLLGRRDALVPRRLPKTIDEFIDRQRWITDDRTVAAIRNAIGESCDRRHHDSDKHGRQ